MVRSEGKVQGGSILWTTSLGLHRFLIAILESLDIAPEIVSKGMAIT